MLTTIGWIAVIAAGTGAIVWGAELFAEHLAAASQRLGVTAFALALLLAGAEPEELATVVTASARNVDGVAFGDVIGTNAAMVTLALGVGAYLAAVPFGPRIRRYAIGGLASGVLAAFFAWDGVVGRAEGAVLAGAYVFFVALIWRIEKQPPPLGEVGELFEDDDDDDDDASGSDRGRETLRDVVMVVIGLAVLTVGSIAIVEGVRQMTHIEAQQTKLGLTVVGLATGLELIVVAWAASKRGISEAVVAGVVGSYAYNMTMSLGAGAVVAPIAISDATLLHRPLVAMIALLALVLLLAAPRQGLDRRHTLVLFSLYAAFVILVVL